MRTCRDCGEDFRSKQKIWRCNSCRYKRAKSKAIKICKSCGGPTTKIVCRSCWAKSQKGEENTRWKGRYKNAAGYILLKKHGHPNAQANGWILEHVFVMSEFLGRPLISHENVHHINGVRDDNRIENLELWSTSQPSGQRVTDKVEWAKQILALYEQDLDKITG